MPDALYPERGKEGQRGGRQSMAQKKRAKGLGTSSVGSPEALLTESLLLVQQIRLLSLRTRLRTKNVAYVKEQKSVVYSAMFDST